MPSQCIVTRSAGIGPNTEPRGRLQYCANVALKVNAKLDGVNVRLAGAWGGGGGSAALALALALGGAGSGWSCWAAAGRH